MRISQHVIWAFFLGGGLGSVIAYFILTLEKRTIDKVRREIDFLGLYHDLPEALYHKTMYPAGFVNDEQVLAAYTWARRAVEHIPKYGLKPTRLAAEVIICEKLLGLSSFDASRALSQAGHDYDQLKWLKRQVNSN